MIKDNHISQGYKQTELGVIPEDWKITELGQGLCFQVGFPFLSDHFNSDAVGLRLIRNRDLKCDDQVVYYSGEYKTEYLVRNGDVLIGMDGDFLPCIWRKGPALLNQRVGRIIVRFDWNTGFLFYLLFEPLLHKQEETGATTVKHLSHKDIERMQLPIPPAIEQQKIAEALSDVDALIVALDKKIAKKRLVKQGAMQQLLTGKKRLYGFAGKWKYVSLEELLIYEQPTKYLVGSAEYVENGIPVLTAGKTFILGYTSETTGIYSIVPVIIFDDFTTDSKYVVKPFKAKSSAMKMLQLRNKRCSLRLIFEVMQMIRFPLYDHQRYWISEYSKLQVYIPTDFREQQAIAAILSDMDQEIADLKTRRDKYKLIKNGMMQKLLTGQIRLNIL